MVLTLDDINTIYEKYEFNNFFYKLTEFHNKPVDFIGTRLLIDTDTCQLIYGLVVTNIFWTGGYFLKSKETGEYYEEDLTDPDDNYALIAPIDFTDDYDLYLHMAVDKNITFSPTNLEWHPISSLTMATYNDDEYIPKKIYLDFHGHTVPETVYAGCCDEGLNPSTEVNVEEDDEGYYIDAVIDDFSMDLFAVSYDGTVFYGNITHLKKLPALSIPTLYKGTPQQISVVNDDTGLPIADFQAYYQGRKLKDNIVELAYDVEDYVDIVIDILDSNYPESRVKLKAFTELCCVSNQSELEEVIDEGIRTVQVIDNDSTVSLNSMDLSDVLLIDSKITVSESKLTNIRILDTAYTDNGDNTLIDCNIETSTLTSNGTPSTFTDCSIIECTVTSMELRLTGAVTDSTLSNSLIISDGIVEITGNIFTGKYTKDYFPSFLYLTGDYLVRNNTFNLSDEWSELQFNMCVIKTLEDFNPSDFINNNTLNLDITYSTEPTDTLYYNIVDNDKIKAKRLS